MLAASKQLVATFALVLFFSFSEMSQGREKQPRNVIDDTLQSFKEQKFRNKRAAVPTTLPPITDGAQLPTDRGNVECGRRKAGQRIVGGTDAQPGSWPWQVIVDFKLTEGPRWCGGVILSPHWIVSAAHCFLFTGVSPIDYTVTVGEHDLRKVEGNEQIIPIEAIILHPDFNPPVSAGDYDVALVKLKKPINFTRNVRPVCLPTMDFAPGTKCFVTGWGATIEKGNGSQILQQAEIPLVSRDTCQRGYDDTGFIITERMRCAGFSEGGVNSCQGDSGGPLVCPRNNKWYLMGIVSWAVGCARPNRYGVYADVLALKAWVQETINDF